MVIPKSIIAIGIVAAVVLAAWYIIPSAEASTDNTLTVLLRNEETGVEYAATIDIDYTRAMSIFGGKFHPLTTFNTELPPLDMNAIYSLSFTVTTSASNAAQLSTIDTQKVYLYSRPPLFFDKPESGYQLLTTNDPSSYQTALSKTNLPANQPNAFALDPFTYVQSVDETGALGTPTALRGKHFNNTMYELSISVWATDTDGHPTYENMTADLTLTVKSPTLIGITIDNVGVST